MSTAVEMFYELVDDTSQFENQKETPWASVGHFMRSEVVFQRSNHFPGV